MAGFLFLRTERHLAAGVPDLSEHCWAGECSSKHSALLQGTAGQHVLLSALPSPQTGMRRCPFLYGHTHSSLSQRESIQCSANGEGVGTNPQPTHTLWAGCKRPPHPAPIQLCSLHHPLWSLCKSGSAPNSLIFVFDSLALLFLQSDSLEILVTILNMNDNIPVFKQTNLTKVVPEVSILWK